MCFSVVKLAGGVIGTHPAFVVPEDYVDGPVEAVLDAPMAANDRAQQARQPNHASDPLVRARRCVA